MIATRPDSTPGMHTGMFLGMQFPDAPTHDPLLTSQAVTRTPFQAEEAATSMTYIPDTVEETKRADIDTSTARSQSPVASNPPADFSILRDSNVVVDDASDEDDTIPVYAYPVLDQPQQPQMIAIMAQPYIQESKTQEPASRPAPAPTSAPTTQSQQQSQGLGGIVRELVSDFEKALFGEETPRQPQHDTIRESNIAGKPMPRRPLGIRVRERADGKYEAFVTLHQPNLAASWSTPQGTRPNELMVGATFETEIQATLAANAMAAPRWDATNERNSCILCHKNFALFRRPHHCRNCGYHVCAQCSNRKWPATMVPHTYHNNEKKVRICDGCHFFMDTFRAALIHGDEELARRTYDTGNVNLYCPYTIYKGAFPIHCAAAGGNLQIIRWLLEECLCALKAPGTLSPLVDDDRLSVLATAAVHGHVEVMRYLVHVHSCSVTEITNVSALQRAVHFLLEAPTPPPEFHATAAASGRMNRRRSEPGGVPVAN